MIWDEHRFLAEIYISSQEGITTQAENEKWYPDIRRAPKRTKWKQARINNVDHKSIVSFSKRCEDLMPLARHYKSMVQRLAKR